MLSALAKSSTGKAYPVDSTHTLSREKEMSRALLQPSALNYLSHGNTRIMQVGNMIWSPLQLPASGNFPLSTDHGHSQGGGRLSVDGTSSLGVTENLSRGGCVDAMLLGR